MDRSFHSPTADFQVKALWCEIQSEKDSFSITHAVGKLLNQRRAGMGWEKCSEPSLLNWGGKDSAVQPPCSHLPSPLGTHSSPGPWGAH